MPTILHKGENFLLAELPALEAGVRQLISKSGDTVILHRIVQGAATISTELNVPIIRSILQAIDIAG